MNKSTYWYGSSPKSWENTKVKLLFKVKNGGTPKSEVKEYWDENGLIWFTPEDVSKEGKNINDSKRKISILGMENSSANFVEPYSLVLSTRAPIGNLKLSTVKFTTNQGCKSLEGISNLDMDYYYYFFSIAKEYLNSLGQGTTFLELSNSSLKNIEVPLPDLNTQRAIANFLNKKTQNIDDLIQAKLKLIELLEEKRQSMITEAVTKGLNPNVKMKDSGVEWIGEIPDHWIVNKIKRVVEILTCGYASTPTYVEKEEGVPFLSAQNVSKSGKLVLDKYNYISHELHSSLTKYKSPLKGDILQVRVGAGIGQTCIIDVDFEFSIYVSLTHIRPSKFIHNRFLKYLLSSKKFNEFASMQTLQAGGVGNLNVSDLEKSRIPYPNLQEQIKISDYLDQKVAEIEEVIDALKTQIEKLKDYRQSLIYEAVTGKIDVRDFEIEA
ncbi:restriction endonuclease subunit S [Bacillus cereus]|uniref:restriction endonuclease subunit S n=1 Tax=Bacillus cereus TaxID=1396 RepID=UPI002AC1D643|nr:restriction endonuclease subunit S [Bacillus cereus]MDZ4422084.1 restriction endonuclease subunit S [Bacillus cereus]